MHGFANFKFPYLLTMEPHIQVICNEDKKQLS